MWEISPMMSRVQFDLSICVTYYGRKTSRPKTQILDPNFTFPLAKWSQVMLRGPANDHQMIARRWTRRTFGPFLLAQSPEHFLRLNRLKIDFGKVKNGSTPFCLGLNHRVVRKKKGWFAPNCRGLEKRLQKAAHRWCQKTLLYIFDGRHHLGFM